MSEKLWGKVAKNFMNAGAIAMPITDTVLEILKLILTEEQAKFLLLFKKRTYNSDEIKTLTDLDEDSLNKMLKELMYIGVISGIPSRSTGIMVYRLTPFFPGVLEFTLMRGETGEKEKKIAQLWEKFFNELVKATQMNYDTIIPIFKKFGKSIERVVPVEGKIEVPQENVLPFEEISKIIEKYDTIGLAHCYCRHRKDLLGDPCKVTDERKNCFALGRAAEFTNSQGFTKQISKEEALRILKECEDAGLVHKAFHHRLDPERDEEAICNCCKCCCGTFDAHYKGASPLMSLTSFIASVNNDECIGCGTCVEICNTEAIQLEDTTAVIIEERCIGCGLCAHHCPEEAINLERTGPRNVFVPPPKIS